MSDVLWWTIYLFGAFLLFVGGGILTVALGIFLIESGLFLLILPLGFLWIFINVLFMKLMLSWDSRRTA